MTTRPAKRHQHTPQSPPPGPAPKPRRGPEGLLQTQLWLPGPPWCANSRLHPRRHVRGPPYPETSGDPIGRECSKPSLPHWASVSPLERRGLGRDPSARLASPRPSQGTYSSGLGCRGVCGGGCCHVAHCYGTGLTITRPHPCPPRLRDPNPPSERRYSRIGALREAHAEFWTSQVKQSMPGAGWEMGLRVSEKGGRPTRERVQAPVPKRSNPQRAVAGL